MTAERQRGLPRIAADTQRMLTDEFARALQSAYTTDEGDDDGSPCAARR